MQMVASIALGAGGKGLLRGHERERSRHCFVPVAAFLRSRQATDTRRNHVIAGVSARNLAETGGQAVRAKYQKLHRGLFIPSPDADEGGRLACRDLFRRKSRYGRGGSARSRSRDLPHYPVAIGIGHRTGQRVDDDTIVKIPHHVLRVAVQA